MNKLKDLSLDELAGYATLAGGFYYLIRRSFALGGHFVEDTFITFRYAQHLSAGEGLVWNIGEPPVEGFTSLLHIILLSIGAILGVPLAVNTLLIGAVCFLALVACYFWCHKQFLGTIRFPAIFLVSIFVLDGRSAIHVTAGMETDLFMLLAALSQIATYLLVAFPSTKTAVGWGFVGLFLLWARPDGFFFLFCEAGILFVLAIMKWHKGNLTLLRNTSVAYAILLLIGLAYFAWKYHYYGYFLPNTFYIKSGGLGLDGLYHIKDFLKQLFKYFGLPVLLVLIATDFQQLKAWIFQPSNVEKLAICVLPPILFLAYFATTVHEVCYANRFEYPAYFGLILFLSIILSAGFSIQKLQQRLSFLPETLSMTIFSALVLVIFGLTTRSTAVYFPWSKIMNEQHYMPIAAALQKTGLKEQATLIFDSAGLVSFYSEFRHIDPVGLTDNYLSGREKLTAMQREKYLWSRNGDVYIGPEPPASENSTNYQSDPRISSKYVQTILLKPITEGPYKKSYGSLSKEERSEALHYRMRELRDNWNLVREMPYPVGNDGYTHFIYVRKDSPYHEKLVAHLVKTQFSKSPELP